MKTTSKTATDFWKYIDKCIAILENEGRWGTARNYGKVKRSFQTFAQISQTQQTSIESPALRLKDIDEDLIERYNRYLYDRGLIRNSVSQYNRVLRAVYNRGVKEHLVSDTRPFENVYVGIDKTVKRALSEREIARIASAPVPERLGFAKDLFIFSYLTCGMTFVDMSYLKKSDIRDSTLIYYRRKTGSRIQIPLEPLAASIVKKYDTQTTGSNYVFPILIPSQPSGRDAYYRCNSALAEYNRALKSISSIAGLSRPVSSYIPRHSWATAARNNGADVSSISEALGHQSERTTRIYLASFDTANIEKVNKRLAAHLRQLG